MNMGSSNRKIKCEKCGTLIPKDAKFCDVCGAPCAAPEHKAFRRKGVIMLIVAAVIALLIASIVMSTVKKREDEMQDFRERNSLADVKDTITPEEYQSIALGTPMREAIEIIGGSLGKHTYGNFASWKWPGEYYSDETHFDSYAQLGFGGEESKLMEKEEHNIIDQEQVQLFRNLGEEYEKIESPTVKLRQILRVEEGMSYNEVTGMMGGEGMLADSLSYESVIDGVTIIKRYVWKCKKKGNYTYVMISFENGNVLIINDKDKLKGVE